MCVFPRFPRSSMRSVTAATMAKKKKEINKQHEQHTNKQQQRTLCSTEAYDSRLRKAKNTYTHTYTHIRYLLFPLPLLEPENDDDAPPLPLLPLLLPPPVDDPLLVLNDDDEDEEERFFKIRSAARSAFSFSQTRLFSRSSRFIAFPSTERAVAGIGKMTLRQFCVPQLHTKCGIDSSRSVA